MWIISPSALYSNGMGTYTISAIMRSSDPILRDIKDVTLLSEKLYIKLNSGRSEITVKYILVNNSDRDYIDLDYAFPVDYIALAGSSNQDKDGNYTGTIPEFEKDGIKGIEFHLNGKELAHQHSESKLLEKANVGYGEPAFVFRRWFYTKVDIKRHSFTNLEVKYSVANLYMCDGDDPTNTSYLGGCGDRHFTYDFSPAKHWGDGIIRDFYVEIDGTNLIMEGDIYDVNTPEWNDELQKVEDKYVSSFKVEGLHFEKTGNRFEYRQRNFDLKKAQPIRISYTAKEMSSKDIITQLVVTNAEYKVRASGEQKKYPVSNLSDMNLETAWVPLKSTGEWVEFTFNKPTKDLAGFCLLAGYYKNAETYLENNRIKKIKAEIKGVGQEWIEVFSWDYYEDSKYAPVYFENIFSHVKVVDFFDIPDILIEKVKITILEVFPGSKYDDTCISEIIFLKNRIYE